MSLRKLETIQEESIDQQQPLLSNRKISEADEEELDQFIPNQPIEFEEEKEKVVKQEKTFVVSSGLQGFFMDDAYGFDPNEQKKEIKRLTINQRFTRVFGQNVIPEEEEDDPKLWESIPKYAAWAIVFYAAFNNSLFPPWIMTIPAEKYLRIAWRFLLQGIFLIPFVMYEYRTVNEKMRQCYNYEYILNWAHMRKLYLASLSTTITFAVFLFCFDYTNISSVFTLGTQTNFWLSVLRNKNQNHDIENGGKTMCIIGFLLINIDSLLLDPLALPPSAYHYINPLLYHREPWMRVVIGNCIPFLACLLLAELAKAHSDLRTIFPPYLTNFIVAFFVSMNMLCVSYFMDGTYVNFDPKWGFFGLFHEGKFMGFFYMSTMLSLGVFISSILISKLFEPLVPATASLFEPVIVATLCVVANVQYFPGAIACFGYVFLMPGQFIIILGQHMLKKEQEQKQLQQQQQQQQQQQTSIAQGIVSHTQINTRASQAQDLKKN